MRRIFVILAMMAGLYLDSVFFARVNIAGIRPDAVMAMAASLGVILGMKPGAIIGLVTGLVADILFSPRVGLSAIGYMAAGLVGGFFYQKYYADNIIIPAAVAAVGALFKECIMAAAARLCGARFDFFGLLGSYILPCALFTALVCMPFHAVMRRLLAGQLHPDRARELQGGAK